MVFGQLRSSEVPCSIYWQVDWSKLTNVGNAGTTGRLTWLSVRPSGPVKVEQIIKGRLSIR